MIINQVTTVDNPFDPFDEFELWYDFDESHGYHSCSLLARLCYSSNGLGIVDNEVAIEEAIDAMIEINPKLYKKVQRNVKSEADQVFTL